MGKFFKKAGVVGAGLKLIARKVVKPSFKKAKSLATNHPSLYAGLEKVEWATMPILEPGYTYAKDIGWKTKPNIIDEWVTPWPLVGAPITAQFFKDFKRNKAIIKGDPYIKYNDPGGLRKPSGKKDTGVTKEEYYKKELKNTIGVPAGKDPQW